MADSGIRTPNLPLGTLTEFLGHAEAAPGVKVVSRIGLDALRALLIASGPIDDRFDAVEAAVGGPSGAAAYVTRLATVERAIQPFTFSGDRALVWDGQGVYGTSSSLYVARNGYFRQGDREFNGFVGTESSDLPGYVGFGNIDPTVVSTAYLDIDANPALKLVAYPATVPTDRPDRVLVLACLWRNQVFTSLPVAYADGKDGDTVRAITVTPQVVETNPIDGNLLLVPQTFVVGRGVTNGFESFAPTGASHWTSSIPSDPAVDWRAFFDLRAARAGLSPIKVVTGSTAPVFGGARHILLATSIGGVVTAGPGQMVVGSASGGLARNQCPISLNADGARYLFNTTLIDAITDPVLTALGFTRGARDTASKRPYYGADMIDPAPNGSVWVRFYVQTDTAADFGNPTAFVIDVASNNPIAVASLTAGTLKLEYARSGTAASFIGRIDLSQSIPGPCYIQVGADNPNGRDLRICGLQFAATRERLSWIGRLDLDSGDADRESAVLGQDVYLIQGQRLPFRVQNGLSRRSRLMNVVASLTSLPANAGGNMYTVQGTPDFVLEADRVGPTGTLTTRSTVSGIDLHAEVPLRFWVSPSSGLTGSPKILLIGDSLTNRRIAAFLSAKLAVMGLTPTFLGTINGAGLAATDWANDITGPLGEGREGWAFADYIGQDTRFAIPTSVAAYNGSSKATKNTLNPFLRASTGSDPAARVYNGKIFDLGQYMTNYLGGVVPDFVVVTLGQNDEARAATAAAATQQVINGLNAMIPSIRAAGANIQVAIGLHTRPRHQIVDGQFAAYRYPNLKAIAAYVRASGDAKLAVLPFWQHMDENGPWTMGQALPPNSVGLTRTFFADAVHFGDEQRHVVAELIRGWIAKGLTGGTAYNPRYAINGQDFSA